jgi:hypothetical protein
LNAKEVKFTAPEESANVSIEISGDGVKAKTQSVRVQGDEPIPEDPEPEVPEQPKNNPVIKINGSASEIEVPRGDSFVGTITVDYGDCNETDLPLSDIEFILTSKVGGAGCNVNGADTVTFTGLGSAPDSNPCTVATISVSMSCLGEPQHAITQTFQVKVPELKEKIFYGMVQEMEVMFMPDADAIFFVEGWFNDKITMDAGPQPFKEWGNDPDAGAYKGALVLLTPPGVNLVLKQYDMNRGDIDVYTTPDIVVNGIAYKVQFCDWSSGYALRKAEVVEL